MSRPADRAVVRPLARNEVDVAVEWAAAEGWNPGLQDADAFWAQDPHGFWGAELDGELVGCASAVSYDGAYGFWGFFIVRPDVRGRRIGSLIAHTTIDGLAARLSPTAAIGLDGVFAQQSYYASLGFAFSHRNLRMAGTARPRFSPQAEVVPLAAVHDDARAAFDTEHFGVARPRFRAAWSDPVDGLALAHVGSGELLGTGVVRRCRDGWKVGPLFARDRDVAEALLDGLMAPAAGDPVFLDVPENNPAALALAADRGMTEVFGCARMYRGTPPPLPWDRVFGVTTFELG